MVVGIMVISFTFFTDSNAMEIAISAMASVFIGIGVNNFSALETHYKDVKAEEVNARKVLALLHKMEVRVSVLEMHMSRSDPRMAGELRDIGLLLLVCRDIIEMELHG